MVSEPPPSFFRELHPLPVVVSRFVLSAELHAKRLGRRAFLGGDVRLELHRIRAGRGDRVDERVREAEAAIVRHRHFADHEASSGAEPGERRVNLCHEWRFVVRPS